MEFSEVIKKRRSVTSFKLEPVPDEVLFKILESARLAPSSDNFQPWKFIIVKDEKRRKKIAEFCMGQKFVGDAPIVIVACGLPTPSKIGKYMPSTIVDVSIASEHLVLSAVNEGLGTCWIGEFDNKKIKRLLNIPEQVQIVGIFPIGYPLKKKIWETPRKKIEEIISFEKYEE